MDKTVLDGNNMKTISGVHLELKRKLKLPNYYGGNLDALWDCLTDLVDLPLEIEWKNYDTARKNLGEYAARVLDLLEDADSVSVTVDIAGYAPKRTPT